jgi:hypothetical protein
MSGNRFYPRKGMGNRKRASATGGNDKVRDKWRRNTDHIPRAALAEWYGVRRRSMQEIAVSLGCSLHKVEYWMEKYGMPKRGHSEALYCKRHPQGDPFRFTPPRNIAEAKLFGLGLGLYWGEGNKAEKNSVRLGNTDPELIKRFI